MHTPCQNETKNYSMSAFDSDHPINFLKLINDRYNRIYELIELNDTK